MTMNLKLSVWFPLPPSGCDFHHSRVHRKSYWDRSQLSTNSPRAGREKALEASDLIAGVDTQEPTKWERFSTVLVPALCASSEFFGGSTAWGRPWFELVSSAEPDRCAAGSWPLHQARRRSAAARQHQAAGGRWRGSRTGCASVLVRVVLIKLFPESGSKFLC